MQFDTKYFGQIDCEEQDILQFPDGLFAFEHETRFLLLPFEGSDGTLLCLQSVGTPTLAFIVMNPFFIKPDYTPVLQPDELKVMEVSRSENLCYYVLCALKKPVSNSTVNLKCPIVINDQTRQAMQVILETDFYHMRHQLSEFRQKAGESSC